MRPAPDPTSRNFTLAEPPVVRQRGFTLIELLVVVAIIVALLAILMPSLGKAVDAAQRAVCVSNTHQQAMSFISYATDSLGVFPTADNVNKGGNQWRLQCLYVMSNAHGRAMRDLGWGTDDPNVSGDPMPAQTIIDCPTSPNRPRGFLSYTLLHVDDYIILTDLRSSSYATPGLNSPTRARDPLGPLTACQNQIAPTGGSWYGNHLNFDGQPDGFPQSFSDGASRWVDAGDLPVNGNGVPLATYDSGWPWKWTFQQN